MLLPFGALRAEMLFIGLRLKLLNWGESSYFLIEALCSIGLVVWLTTSGKAFCFWLLSQ
jgi:hypothetical protein